MKGGIGFKLRMLTLTLEPEKTLIYIFNIFNDDTNKYWGVDKVLDPSNLLNP